MLRRAVVLVFALALAAAAQKPAAPPPPPAEKLATVQLEISGEFREPKKMVLSVDLAGQGEYAASDNGDGAVDYRQTFQVAPATRDRIFALTQELGYFEGDFDFRKHRIADSGRKVLTYEDAVRRSSTTFNWSENKALQELAGLLEGIATTQAFGRKLQYQRRFDRLGLNDTLKRLEELARMGLAAELGSIAPVLRQIANDNAVLKIARERAARLLDLAAAPATANR